MINKNNCSIRNSDDSTVSVIVPVYNVEQYLKKCVESILNQTYKNIQIILVDDGSTDKSLSICRKYETEDNRIVVITKENGGLSSARNCGLRKASGQYIVFVDSDDYIETDMVENLYDVIIEYDADISCCGYFEEYPDKSISRLNKSRFCVNSIDALKKMLYLDDINTSACNKMYKKILWDNIEFPEGHIFEDMATVYKIILKADRICHIPFCGYHYVMREGSITNQSKFNSKYFDSLLYSKQISKAVEEMNDEELIKAADAYYCSQLYDVILKIRKQNGTDTHRADYKMLKNEFSSKITGILLNDNIPIKRKASYMLEYIGLNEYIKSFKS